MEKVPGVLHDKEVEDARALPDQSHHYAGVALAWHPCRR